MHWLIRCSFLLATLTLSYQSQCPFSGLVPSVLNILTGILGVGSPPDCNESNNDGSTDGAMQFECAKPPTTCSYDPNNYYRKLHGSCNNLVHPGMGMAKSRYTRILPPRYGDGKYTPTKSVNGSPLPSARVVSTNMYGEKTFKDIYRTMASMQWGQFNAHDITQQTTDGAPNDCCANPNHKRCFPIRMDPNDPIAQATGQTCLNFPRTLSDADFSCPYSNVYAERISMVTPYLDLSSLYGNSVEVNLQLRTLTCGLLKTSGSPPNTFVPIVSCSGTGTAQCFNMADGRNQIVPTLAGLHNIFAREHNRLAALLCQLNPQFTDEKIFQLARKINIGQYQKISYYDWLPGVLGTTFCYDRHILYTTGPQEFANDYDPSMDPGPLADFAAAAFRNSHNQIPGWFSLLGSNGFQNQTKRLSDFVISPNTVPLLQANMDQLILGLITQSQKYADKNIDVELKHFFGRGPSGFGTDLNAIDIQRGRDFALASYNDWRQYCGLPRAYNWNGFSDAIPADKISLMQTYYASPNDVDLSVGGSMENRAPDSLFGPTFQCIISIQYLKARKSDRFFYEHDDKDTGFTREQLGEIRKATLASILCANTQNLNYVQPNVFLVPNDNNPLVECSSIPQLNIQLWQA